MANSEEMTLIHHLPFAGCPSLFAVLAVYTLAGPFGSTAIGAAVEVEVERIDGTLWQGTWVGSIDGRSLELRGPGGSETIPLDGLARITFARAAGSPASTVPGSAAKPVLSEAKGWVPPSSAPDTKPERNGKEPPRAVRALFHLADGGRLHGELTDPVEGSDALFGRTPLAEVTTLAYDRLAAVQLVIGDRFPRSQSGSADADAFRQALANRRPGQDILVTRGSDDVKILAGRLELLGTQRGLFAFGGRVRTFQTSRIYGVIFAAGAVSQNPKRYPVTATLRDGSVFSGQLLGADAVSIRMATSWGLTVDVALANLSNLRIFSERVVYVSDLEPPDEHVEGILHSPSAVRRDRNVADGPLKIGGRHFDKGLGVHSRTELTYQIDGDYAEFAATIGLDDAVRPRGSVVFSVRGDGRILFDSAELTGSDPPRDVIVNVLGVETLTLIVDFGRGLDLGDYADWGNARLLRPPTRTGAPHRQ